MYDFHCIRQMLAIHIIGLEHKSKNFSCCEYKSHVVHRIHNIPLHHQSHQNTKTPASCSSSEFCQSARFKINDDDFSRRKEKLCHSHSYARLNLPNRNSTSCRRFSFILVLAVLAWFSASSFFRFSVYVVIVRCESPSPISVGLPPNSK